MNISASINKTELLIRQYAKLSEPKRKAIRQRLLAEGFDTTSLPIIARSQQDALPLSFAQERLWFLWRLEPESAAYNVAGAVRLGGDLDVRALRSAVDALVMRH